MLGLFCDIASNICSLIFYATSPKSIFLIPEFRIDHLYFFGFQEIGALCEQLPALTTLNLSCNSLESEVTSLPLLKNIRVLVLNNSGVSWTQVICDYLTCYLFSRTN